MMKTIKRVSSPVVEVHSLTVSYHHQPVLWEIDFTLPSSKLIGIVGPNGAGKSTLIKTMMELHPADSGAVRFWGKDMNEVRHKISYMPQCESVDWDFPASVYDVVMMGRYAHMGLFKRPTKEDDKIVCEAIARVGLTDFIARQIGQLSGGQRQRVFFARALAQDASLYFMDEPLAAIDATTCQDLLRLLQEMTQQGKTVVIVHHDLASAQAYFDWVLLLNMRIIASGPTQEVFQEDLIKETYGTKLTILNQVGELVQQQAAPLREEI